MKAILEAQQKSKLYSDNIATFRQTILRTRWFVKFMQMLGRGVSKENIRNIFDRVSFIVFNYDRCLEHFLLHALQQAYGIRRDEAEAILSGVRIIHPYGLVDKAVPSALRAPIMCNWRTRLKPIPSKLTLPTSSRSAPI